MPEQDRAGQAGPGGAVAARTPGDGTPRDAGAIVTEIEATRQQLAVTIDALAARVSPKNQVRQLRERAVQQLGRPPVQAGAAATGLLVVVLVAWRIRARRRG